MSETRYCRDCQEQRPIEEFYRLSGGRYSWLCKKHEVARNARYQKEKPEAHRRAAREYKRRQKKLTTA